MKKAEKNLRFFRINGSVGDIVILSLGEESVFRIFPKTKPNKFSKFRLHCVRNMV